MKDKRFKIANREAIIGVILVLINFIWWYAFAYGMGSGDPTSYTYICFFSFIIFQKAAAS